MDELIVGLLEIINEQHLLITELVSERPETKHSPEIKRALLRIASKIKSSLTLKRD